LLGVERRALRYQAILLLSEHLRVVLRLVVACESLDVSA
jgi:hypothetical protein